MAKKVQRNNSPYSKRRIKTRKVEDIKKKQPFKEELKDPRKNTRLIKIVAGIIIVVMIGTLILPYLMNGASAKNYTLPDEVLKQAETSTEKSYSAQYISLGETFNRVEKDYYVLFSSQQNLAEVLTKLAGKTYYIVNTDIAPSNKVFENNNNINAKPSKASEVKVKDVGLIHIKDGKCVEFFSNKADILSKVK